MEAELHDLENSVGHIITQLYKLVLHVFEHDAVCDDTESAHSEEGETHSPDHRELIQGVLQRFANQFNSVVEVSTNMQDQITGHHQQLQREDDDELDDEGVMQMQSVSSAGFGGDTACHVASVSSSAATLSGSAVSSARETAPGRQEFNWSYEEPAWIHDSKSLRNEKSRLHAELAATKSELRRLQRRHEDLEVQFEAQKNGGAELQDVLTEYEQMNSNLKQQLAKLSDSHDDVKVIQDHKRGFLTTETCVKASANHRDAKTSEDTNVPEGKYRSNNYGTIRSEMKRLRHVTDDMEEEMERMNQETISLRMRGLKMERDRKDLREKLRLAETLGEETRCEVVSLDKQCAELETRCQSLEQEKASGQAENERTSRMLSEARSCNRTFERENSEIEKIVKLLEVEKKQQRTELDKLEQSKFGNDNKMSRLTKEHGDLQMEMLQLSRDKSSLEADVAMVREENETNSAGRKQAEEACRLATTELRELQSAYSELNEQICRLQDTATTAESCCKILKEQNEALVSKTQELEASNETLENRTRELSNTGRLLEVENSELKHMVRRLRTENKEMKTKISTLTNENADFREKCDEWSRENASAGDKMRNLVRTKGDLQTIFHQLASLGSDAASRFERMDNDCASLQELQQRRKKTHSDESIDTTVSEVTSLVALRD